MFNDRSAGSDSMATIMIVDDEPKIVELISDMLSPLEHEIVCAYNGDEALKKLEDIKPDLVLLDIMMPGVDGLEVCQKIKENPEMSDVSVVMVTGKRDLESHMDAIFAEANGYIMKPFTVDGLVDKVVAFLEKGEAAAMPKYGT
jgi:DNA-binding response OmpR family regulator